MNFIRKLIVVSTILIPLGCFQGRLPEGLEGERNGSSYTITKGFKYNCRQNFSMPTHATLSFGSMPPDSLVLNFLENANGGQSFNIKEKGVAFENNGFLYVTTEEMAFVSLQGHGRCAVKLRGFNVAPYYSKPGH